MGWWWNQLNLVLATNIATHGKLFHGQLATFTRLGTSVILIWFRLHSWGTRCWRQIARWIPVWSYCCGQAVRPIFNRLRLATFTGISTQLIHGDGNRFVSLGKSTKTHRTIWILTMNWSVQLHLMEQGCFQRCPHGLRVVGFSNASWFISSRIHLIFLVIICSNRFWNW